jgi:DAACS family dicarboxylate/amino acid:cation (Na+ or H+) symporter
MPLRTVVTLAFLALPPTRDRVLCVANHGFFASARSGRRPSHQQRFRPIAGEPAAQQLALADPDRPGDRSRGRRDRQCVLRPPEAGGSANVHLAWVAHNIAEPIGQIFLRLIFMVVVPLVFCALTLGVAGIGDVRRLGRLGVRTLLLTLMLPAASVVIGITLANTLRPGMRLSPVKRVELRERYASGAATAVAQARQAKPLRDTLLDIIPKNPLQEMVGAIDGSSPGGGTLAVMFFAPVFGVALTLAGHRTQPLIAVLEGIYDVVMIIIGMAMRLAPLGVAALVFSLTAVLGLDTLKTLFWFVLTVLAGLALHMFGVYSVLVSLFARLSPRRFFGRITEAMLTAFATPPSNATLPTALRVAEDNLGIRREVAGFVLTVGSTGNQNGTALYEGITVLFLAQVFGLDLTLTQQVTVALMAVLAGIGTAGVPGGSLPLVVLVLQSVGIPGEGIGIILGADRLLDMCRTTLNVTGDIAVAACGNRGESRRPLVVSVTAGEGD